MGPGTQENTGEVPTTVTAATGWAEVSGQSSPLLLQTLFSAIYWQNLRGIFEASEVAQW